MGNAAAREDYKSKDAAIQAKLSPDQQKQASMNNLMNFKAKRDGTTLPSKE